MKERQRVAEMIETIRGGLKYALMMEHPEDYAADAAVVHEPARVAAFPNQIVATVKGREFTITVTENRKSRLK